MTTPTDPDAHQTPPDIIARTHRTPAQRIHDMKAADHDAATAGPIVVAIPDGADFADLARLGERLAAETANRRWLMDLVEQLLHRVDTVAHNAERNYEQFDHEDLRGDAAMLGRAEGAADVATALNTIMTTYRGQQ